MHRLLLAGLLPVLASCAGVTVHSVSPADYLATRRGDILTTRELSASSQDSLRVIGMRPSACRRHIAQCREDIASSGGLSEERRQATLSELWLQSALKLEEQRSADPTQLAELNAWLETARHAMAYLFFTERRPGERAFEDRQTQVRDYYNYAVQKAVTLMFQYRQQSPPVSGVRSMGSWRIGTDITPLSQHGPVVPQELIAASSLGFSGLRNIYRRDGFGAELVAGLSDRNPLPSKQRGAVPYREMSYPVVTALLNFKGETLEEILSTREVQMVTRDPYRTDTVEMAGEVLPLAANFTAGYGLWLARSGFARQAMETLFGRGDAVHSPRVYLMQPYDPERRIIIMLHGLASSPEAWINVANEVLGDETLRQSYQIWQVYYPTNAPLVMNNRAINLAIQETLAHFDPQGRAPASRDITLIGHSMGGVLARLMVSSSGERVWNDLMDRYAVEPELLARLRKRVGPYLHFEPLPQVSHAVFIAAPHRGTPYANWRLARWIANLVTLPLAVLHELQDISLDLAQLRPRNRDQTLPTLRIPNSIDNLSDRDDFIRITADLPISPKVRYHSIIGNDTPKRPVTESDDGLVPYASAHLQGAASERVVRSAHSVQENPTAILEIRRILREQLQPRD